MQLGGRKIMVLPSARDVAALLPQVSLGSSGSTKSIRISTRDYSLSAFLTLPVSTHRTLTLTLRMTDEEKFENILSASMALSASARSATSSVTEARTHWLISLEYMG